MFRPPCPREAHPGGNGAPWASLGRQEPVGFEDTNASRVDGTDFIYDLSNGGIGSGSYFTDLLGGEVQESQEFSPNTESPIESVLRLVLKDHRVEQIILEMRRTGYSIEDRNQCGASIADKIANACTLFKEEDKKNRKFAFMHCWKILKDSPKWMERRKQFRSSKTASNKKQKTEPNSSPSSATPELSTGAAGGDDGVAQDASKRPDGKKTEKKRLRQRATIEALDYLVAKMK
ncbi:hypothetical protein ACP4OV_007308 [Aristida adscensionis]